MKISIRTQRNTLLPSIRKGLATSSRPAPVWRAGALALVQYTKSAFSDSGKRVSPWKARWGGSAATLRKSGTLWRSVHVTESTDRGAKVGASPRYAAIHQFGGTVFAPPGGFLKFPGGDKAFVKGAQSAAKKSIKSGGKGNPRSAGFVFRKWVKIPARPYFPFDRSGRATAQAQMAVSLAMRRALDREIKGGS